MATVSRSCAPFYSSNCIVRLLLLGMERTIQKLLSSADGDNTRIVSVVESVLDILKKESLAWYVRLPPKLVGVHPENRGGWGVTPAGVHQLGSKIAEMGFDPAATAHAVCIEDQDGAVANFTQKLADSSDGLLGGSSTDVKYGSVSRSHTNQFLVGVLTGVRTDFENLAIDGRMSYAKLSVDEHMKTALDAGLMWLVISAKAVTLFPKLPQLVQAAKNVTGALHQKEDAFQVLQQLQGMAAAEMKSTGTVNWDVLKKIIARRTQCSPDDVATLVQFAQKFGGGTSTAFVDDLAIFHRTFVPPNRVVPMATWSALAHLRTSVQELCPYFVYSVIKCQATCSQSKCDGDVAKFITTSEINTLATHRKDSMIKAERLLTECRSLAKASTVSAETRARALGRLDNFIVRVVLNKKGDRQSMESIVEQFAKDIGSTNTTSPAAVAEQPVPNVVHYDDDGKPIAGGALMLRTEGFDVGSRVKRDADLFTIKGLHDNGDVDVIDDRTGSKHTIAHDEFLVHFKKTTEVFDELVGWMDCRPCVQPSYIDSVVRAKALAAMAMLADGSSQSVRIVLKPTRGVFATASHNVNKLTLFPETTKIVFDNRTSGSFKGTVDSRDVYFCPTPCTPTFAVPAWAVQYTSDEQLANLHVVTKRVVVKLGEVAVDVCIPALVNNKKVKDGCELPLYKAPVDKAPSQGKRALHFRDVKPKAKAKASK
jgi:hypothetical protein